MQNAKTHESGQALLIVILGLVVMIVVILSVASKSLVAQKDVAEQKSSEQAFSAAEAGIEQSLKTNTGISGSLTDNLSPYRTNLSSKYQTNVTVINNQQFFIHGGIPVNSDVGGDVWLSTYSTDSTKIYTNQFNGTMIIYWGASSSNQCAASGSSNTMSAIEITLLYNDTGTSVNQAKIQHFAFDPCSQRRAYTHFSAATVGATVVNGLSFPYSASVNIRGGFVARVTPLYSDSIVATNLVPSINGTQLPQQGSQISSLGQSGDTTRKLSVFQGYPELPAGFFQSILFSPTSQ